MLFPSKICLLLLHRAKKTLKKAFFIDDLSNRSRHPRSNWPGRSSQGRHGSRGREC